MSRQRNCVCVCVCVRAWLHVYVYPVYKKCVYISLSVQCTIMYVCVCVLKWASLPIWVLSPPACCYPADGSLHCGSTPHHFTLFDCFSRALQGGKLPHSPSKSLSAAVTATNLTKCGVGVLILWHKLPQQLCFHQHSTTSVSSVHYRSHTEQKQTHTHTQTQCAVVSHWG